MVAVYGGSHADAMTGAGPAHEHAAFDAVLHRTHGPSMTIAAFLVDQDLQAPRSLLAPVLVPGITSVAEAS